MLEKKLKRLKDILKKMNSVLVAYSAGVDSSFLLKVCKDVLSNRVLAVTAVSENYPKEELNQAKRFAKELNVRHMIIKTEELKNPKFKKNDLERCYFCKKELFTKLNRIAKQNNIDYVIDGSNFDDLKDYRPGRKAKEEMGVYSPLQMAKLSKNQIRVLAKKMGILNWDKPKQTCLSSRIPYGRKITPFLLKRIEKGENFLRRLGFKELRLRDYWGGIARIEIEKKDFLKIFRDGMDKKIVRYLKKLGYVYITLDLEGYRSGSMNEVFKKKIK